MILDLMNFITYLSLVIKIYSIMEHGNIDMDKHHVKITKTFTDLFNALIYKPLNQGGKEEEN